MRAMVIHRFGGPEELKLEERPKPVPEPGEVLVKVCASGTNPVDAKIRAQGAWAGLRFPAVLGYDVSGVIEALGAGVRDFQVGDEVFYTPEIHGNSNGSYAEYNAVSAAIIARKPKSVDHLMAAAIPLAGGTAYEAVVRRLRLEVGETILIHGGAGGVGSFAVQLAHAAGARVLASASSRNQKVLQDLGADVAIDYSREDPAEVALRETGGRGVDAVFDTVGGELIARSARAVRPFGRLATILDTSGQLGLSVNNLTLHGVFLLRERARLEALRGLVDRGQLKPLVAEILPMEQVAQAHRRLDSGHGTGKVVLKIA